MQPVAAKITSKHQFTIPKTVWKATGLKVGDSVDVLPQGRGFQVQPRRRELLIMKYRGWLKHLDDGRPMAEIIEEAHRAAARHVLKRAHRR